MIIVPEILKWSSEAVVVVVMHDYESQWSMSSSMEYKSRDADSLLEVFIL